VEGSLGGTEDAVEGSSRKGLVETAAKDSMIT
jgi:hypothetical protein